MEYVLNALNVIFIIFEVLVIFNLLILVHEIGHFLAAKWRGLHIEELGIWFGKPLWKKKIAGVNYSFGSIPFGGFVKLPQMSPMETIEGESETKREELPQISALDKIIVAFAGPLFSFGLACVFALIVWQVGRPVSESEKTTVVGYVVQGMPAEKVGIKPGDQILEIDGHKINRWSGMADDSLTWWIVRSEGKTVEVKVRRDGQELTFNPEPAPIQKAHWWNRPGLRQIGLAPEYTVLVDEVKEGSNADKARLKKDDQIVEINGEKLFHPIGMYDYMKDHPADTYDLTVRRNGTLLGQKIPFTAGGVKVTGIPDYPNSPAKLADLKVGDVITMVDGKKLHGASAFTDYIGKHGGVAVSLGVERDGKALPNPIEIKPQIPEQAPDGAKEAMIGVTLTENDGLGLDDRGLMTPSHPGPVEQVRASMMMILDTLDAVFSPKSKIGVQQMGGPIMMMHVYYSMFSMHDGWKMALWFSVILNVNLALLNLLPIPVLDGGHIVLAIIEAIRRRPPNLRVLEFIQGTCAVVIIGFMLFIMFYDVQDLPFVHQQPAISFKAQSGDNSR